MPENGQKLLPVLVLFVSVFAFQYCGAGHFFQSPRFTPLAPRLKVPFPASLSDLHRQKDKQTHLHRATPPWTHPLVGARNRCHLSNCVLTRKRCIFLAQKGLFCQPCLCPKCYRAKHFGQDSLFHKKPKLRRRNHYFCSVKMGERAKSLWKPRFGPQSLKT